MSSISNINKLVGVAICNWYRPYRYNFSDTQKLIEDTGRVVHACDFSIMESLR